MKGASYVMLAPQPSSDLLGAELYLALRDRWNVDCYAMGGEALRRAKAISLLDKEIHHHSSTIPLQQADLLERIRRLQPNCVVQVGYQPGIARLLERLHLERLPVVLYAPPFYSQWSAADVEALKNYPCAHVFGVFPFEEAFYEGLKLPYTYVGSPHHERTAKVSVSRAALGLPEDKKVLLLLPGSRPDMFRRLMPLMLKSAALLRGAFDLHVVLPVAEGISEGDLRAAGVSAHPYVHVVPRMGLECISTADFALTGNGTVSLECPLLCLPHLSLACISDSRNICNLIAGTAIVPELPVNTAPETIAAHVKDLLGTSSHLSAMRESMARQNTFYQPFAAEVAAGGIERLSFSWQKKKGASGA